MKNHLTDHGYGHDDVVQPLYNWPCEGDGLIIVSCHRVLVALDHPVTVESPIGRSFSKFCLHYVALVMCMGRCLGSLVCLVYFAEQLSMVCKTNMHLLPGMDHPTYWWWSSKLASWSDWKQWLLQVSSPWNFVTFISSNTHAHWACGKTVLSISRIEWV